jgi:hypothetical protein
MYKILISTLETWSPGKPGKLDLVLAYFCTVRRIWTVAVQREGRKHVKISSFKSRGLELKSWELIIFHFEPAQDRIHRLSRCV